MTSRFLLAASLLCATAPISAQIININFNAAFPNRPVSDSYGGAAGQAGFWNTVSEPGPVSLKTIGGETSDVTLSLSIGTHDDTNSGMNPVLEMRGSTSETHSWAPFYEMLTTHFYAAEAGTGANITSYWTLEMNGLANGTYDLYYYAPTNSFISTGNFTANGVSATSIEGGVGSELIQGVHWDKLELEVTDGSLIASTIDNPQRYTGLAGIQLVGTSLTAVPEPDEIAFLCGVLGLAFLVIRRGAVRPCADG